MRDQRRMSNVLNGMGDPTSDFLASLADQASLDYFGTTDVYGATTATPPAVASSGGFSFSDLGNILNAAGQVYSFATKLDAAGNPVPASAPAPAATAAGSKISPAILIMLGIGAFLVLR